jgi:hypothetical protein
VKKNGRRRKEIGGGEFTYLFDPSEFEKLIEVHALVRSRESQNEDKERECIGFYFL